MAAQAFHSIEEKDERLRFAFEGEFGQAISDPKHDAFVFAHKLPDGINPLARMIFCRHDLPMISPSIDN